MVKDFFIFILIICFAFPVWAGDPNGLDEIQARKSRYPGGSGVPYGGNGYEDDLEDAGNYWIWQPEYLCYIDDVTGVEVCKVIGLPMETDFFSNITWPQISADGKRLAWSSSRDSNNSDVGTRGSPIWMHARTDGTYIRPNINSSGTASPSIIDDSNNNYFAWSPAEIDVQYITPGAKSAELSGRDRTHLYKITWSDTSYSEEDYLTLDDTEDATFVVDRGMSPDGQLIVLLGRGGNAQDNYHPVKVFPVASKEVYTDFDEDGDRDWSTIDSWGETPNSWTGRHAAPKIIYDGTDYWMMFQLQGGNAKWLLMVPGGSANDGGPEYEYAAGPADPWDKFNHTTSGKPEMVPINTPADGGPQDPFGSNYWSHPINDPWGDYMVFTDSLDVSIWDFSGAAFHNEDIGANGAQHQHWAFSDHLVHNTGTEGASGPVYFANDMISYYNINIDVYGQADAPTEIAQAWHNFNDGYEAENAYETAPRVTASPDGTKAFFHCVIAEELPDGATAEQVEDLCFAVVYYPFPPEIISVSYSGGVVVRFDWRHASEPNFTDKIDWVASTNYSINDFVRPVTANGYLYEVTTDSGSSDSGEPTWTTVPGETVVDDGITWTCRSFPRGYTQRPYPDAADDPPIPRETELFRLWRSPDDGGDAPTGVWTVIDTVAAAPFTQWDFSDGSLKGGQNGYWEITDATAANDTKYHYIVTAQEWSGLESRRMSNAWLVEVGTAAIDSDEQSVKYPAAPGGDDNFFSTAQGLPVSVTANHNISGKYTITWSEPASSTYIRYYNIYALDDTNPTAIQQRRIASVPATHDKADGTDDGDFSWIDVFGDPQESTRYGITSVSFQGDESAIVLAGEAGGGAEPTSIFETGSTIAIETGTTTTFEEN